MTTKGVQRCAPFQPFPSPEGQPTTRKWTFCLHSSHKGVQLCAPLFCSKAEQTRCFLLLGSLVKLCNFAQPLFLQNARENGVRIFMPASSFDFSVNPSILSCAIPESHR